MRKHCRRGSTNRPRSSKSYARSRPKWPPLGAVSYICSRANTTYTHGGRYEQTTGQGIYHLDCAIAAGFALSTAHQLAAIALGIVRRKRLQGGQTPPALPLAGTRDTREKRVHQLLRTPDVTVERYDEPLARRLLQQLAADSARIPLTLKITGAALAWS